jgi:hypothetical protein
MSSLFIELQSDEETFCKIIENFSQNFLVEKIKLGEDND